MIWIKSLLILLYFINNSQGLYRRSNIVFENNGYKNVLIAISDNVPEDQSLINKIKASFIATSKTLYKATKKRAYFKQIVILVPHNWANNPAYGTASPTQTLQLADVVISGPIQRGRRHISTRSYSGCGRSGIHIQLLSDFFSNPGFVPNCFGGKPCYSKEDYIGRKLVHVWANFRWGVYNEYPSQGESQFYFSTLNGRSEAVRCALGLRGSIFQTFPNGSMNTAARCLHTDPTTGMYPKQCKYFPYPYRNMATASIMDQQWINEIVNFCDDDKAFRSKTAHNSEPPNKHNRLCSHRSTWDVITNTADFKGNINPPRNVSVTEQEPQFVLVKASATKRVAIIMDTPATSEKSLTKRDVHQAVHDFVERGIEANSEFVLLQTGAETKVLHPLIKIRSAKDKQTILEAITKSEGETKTTSGLAEALTNMVNGVDSGEKHIVLIYCGNTSLTIDGNLKRQIQQARATVHVISCNIGHSPLVETIQHIGGQFHHVKGRQGLTSMLDGIHEISKRTNRDRQSEQKLFSQAIIFDDGTRGYRRNFSVDSSIGDGIHILIAYNDTLPSFTIESPSGKIYGTSNHNSELKLCRIYIDRVEKGSWTINMKNKSHFKNFVTIIVSGSPNPNVPPIELFGHVNIMNDLDNPVFGIFAEVSRAHNPIIGLNVTASVETPDGTLYQLQLLDNGAGVDVEADDGVYSRYFTKVSQAGHYNIRIVATNQNDQTYFKEISIEETHQETDTWTSHKPVLTRKKRQIDTGLSRTMSGSVYVTEGDMLLSGISRSSDPYPPARVTDLKVVNISQVNRTVTLTWTAPGDDLDDGRALLYDLRYDNNGVNLLKLKDEARPIPPEYILTGNLNNPKESGQREVLKLKFPLPLNKNASLAFILRGRDKYGNAGQFSNLATTGLMKTTNVVYEIEKEKTVDEPVALLITLVLVIIFILLAGILTKCSYNNYSVDKRFSMA